MEMLRALKTHPKGVMVFWAQGLTNVPHFFFCIKYIIKKKTKFGPSKCDQSWFFELMV